MPAMQSLRVLEGAASVVLLLEAEQVKKHLKVLGIEPGTSNANVIPDIRELIKKQKSEGKPNAHINRP